MKRSVLLNNTWPLVGLGVLVAVACLASTWYINRLQADLARAIRHDAARLQAAEELQIELRQLRFHTIVYAANQSETRRGQITEDQRRMLEALAIARQECTGDDLLLIDEIQQGYQQYVVDLRIGNTFDPPIRTLSDLMSWSDGHKVSSLLIPCRELAQRQRNRMNDNLQRSETQTVYAGRMLVGLGLIGAVGGVLSGYLTARRLTRRTAQLSVRVQAVQSHLDQEIGDLTVEKPRYFGDLDAELDLVVGRVKEVCERLQAQERDLLRAEQLAAVGQLAAGVAHEIRNPLTGIKILVDAAIRAVNPSPLTPTDLGLIRDEIIRLERTVQGLLDFARTPRMQRRKLDLKLLIAQCLEALRGRAEAKSITILSEASSTPITVEVDSDQFHSLLTNVLINAIDAVPPHGTVVIRNTILANDMIEVVVADSGPGIDPKILSKLFTPFATTKSSGTGLGLAIARRVARDHGGDLIAENRPEGGAEFTIRIPKEGKNHVEIAGG